MTPLEKKIDTLLKKVTQLEEVNSWITKEKFIERTGYNEKKVEKLIAEYPHIAKPRKGDKVDTIGRTVRRGFIINYTAFLNLHTSPLV